jgi:Anti-sigma-K factor rskA, C-terminal
VQPQTSDVELRLSELQTEIDGLNLALQQWRQIQEHTQPMEQRLAQLTEQCADILNRWTATDARHSEAVAEIDVRLSDWRAIESRLQQDSRERLRELEQTIEHEWHALRRMHEEPVKQLREQAATLGETCVAAANLALRGFERAETRFAALEQDLLGRMNQLSQDLQAAIAAIHDTAAQRQGSLPSASSPFPLEGVMRIHDGLRESAEADGKAAPHFPRPGESRAPSGTMHQLPEAASALSERMATLERAVGEATDTAQRTEGFRRTAYTSAAVLVLALVVATGFMIRGQSRTEGRLNEAIARATAAERQANARVALADKQTAATRDEADRQVADARQAAAQAQTVSTVLTAPDLIRFGLVGRAPASRASAQVLFSRSRGLVVSASRLPQVPAGRAYQLWLLTRTTPVRAGVITVDDAGRATFVGEIPPNLPRVVGAAVTIEPAGGSRSPTGAMVLARDE